MSTGADDKTARPDLEPFLDRWSRRKAEARSEAEAQKPAGQAPAPSAEQAPPALPPVEELDLSSDYRAFFHPKVNEDTRRAALKRLFSDSRFNIMDGLDVYIDDYSKSDPIPPAMLAGLRQAQNILEWAKGQDEQAPGARGKQEVAASAPPAQLDSPRPAAVAPRSEPEPAADSVAGAPEQAPGNRASGRA